MSRAAALREHDDMPNTDDLVVLHGITWEDYEHLLEMRGDHSAPRISYLDGEVEIMSPSRDHEQIKSYIGHLLEAWCIDRGIEVSPYGSWTLKKKKKKSGAEADECYVFGKERRGTAPPPLPRARSRSARVAARPRSADGGRALLKKGAEKWAPRPPPLRRRGREV